MINRQNVKKIAYAISGFGSMVCPAAAKMEIGHNNTNIVVSRFGLNGRRTFTETCVCGAERRHLEYAKNVRKRL